MTPAEIEARVAADFLAACRAELRALKPGNVHDHAPGHRMTVADFEASAAVAAPAIARHGAPVGERVREAVAATMVAVGQNTNLGILLLSAPLAAAFEACGGAPAGAVELRAALGRVLGETTRADAAAVYEAIRLANPGGLGSAADEDVSGAPTVTLTEAMGLAADRDRIARQYATTFEDIFSTGLPVVFGAMVSQVEPAFATQDVYFAFAAGFSDTHVTRKHGVSVAAALQRKFAEQRVFSAARDQDALLVFDRELKELGLNPGTSADLTVATEFAARLCGYK